MMGLNHRFEGWSFPSVLTVKNNWLGRSTYVFNYSELSGILLDGLHTSVCSREDLLGCSLYASRSATYSPIVSSINTYNAELALPKNVNFIFDRVEAHELLGRLLAGTMIWDHIWWFILGLIHHSFSLCYLTGCMSSSLVREAVHDLLDTNRRMGGGGC